MTKINMKGLAKDTAIYGLSSIVGRALNWGLTPLYVYTLANTSEFGKVSQLYGYTALLLVLLTYGMETGFFRFMNKEGENKSNIYSTSLISLGTTSILFILTCFVFIDSISVSIKYAHKDHILIMAVIVAFDAFMAIPYAKLRYDKRPIRFATVRLVSIFTNIFFNLFFLVLCPYIYQWHPELIDWFYVPGYGIGYIFLSNLFSALINFVMLSPTVRGIKFTYDPALLKRILKYSYPMLILGIAGIISQTVVPLTYPYLYDNIEEAQSQLGIYTACFKLTLIINMFIQAFRYAYEPFVFSQNRNNQDNTRSYSQAMKYFIIFTLFIFLGVMFYMDLIKHFVTERYYVGLSIVPIAMMGEIFFGIYFNLSIWYKLTDKTQFGAMLSILGCVITLVSNIVFVPMFGFMASAWTLFVCNFTIMIISYFLGQKYFPVKYDLKSGLFYFTLAIVFYYIGTGIEIDNQFYRLGYRTLLLLIFSIIVIKKDLPLKEIPIIGKYFKS